jgi:NAD(P)-dependent dehydrogenase (short-subunit alcohol dehydrogenase family)
MTQSQELWGIERATPECSKRALGQGIGQLVCYQAFGQEENRGLLGRRRRERTSTYTRRSVTVVEGLNRLKDKVAIVTGAGSRGEGIGNGRATAILFARERARVALVDANQEWAEATLEMFVAEGGERKNCAVIEADVSDEAACKGMVSQTVEKFGRVDVLVNNVGVAGPDGTAVEVDPEEWDEAMKINVKSMMLTAKYCVPEFRKVGGGAIVNISSVAGLTGGHPRLLYSTSKGAVVNMTRAMAADHGSDGIRVNAIAPGMVYTPMVASRGMTSDMREARRQRSLLQTEGTGWDVAKAALFLASEDARWITGVILPVDAGATAAQAQLPTPPSNAEGFPAPTSN